MKTNRAKPMDSAGAIVGDTHQSELWCVNRCRQRDQGAISPGFFLLFSGRRSGSFGSYWNCLGLVCSDAGRNLRAAIRCWTSSTGGLPWFAILARVVLPATAGWLRLVVSAEPRVLRFARLGFVRDRTRTHPFTA